MKIVKGLALSLLSFLLFLSLSIFGLAFMLNSTVLNPRFITSELDRLDIPAVAEELFSKQTPGEEFPVEFRTALVNTITKLEPLVKEQISAIIYPIYDYLKGKSQSVDLVLTLRSTILNSGFIASVIDEADISPLAARFLGEQVTEQIPEGMVPIIEGLLDDVITELKPTIKAELTAAADPILDYMLRQSQSLNVVISLEPVREKLKDALSENLAGLSPETVEPYFKEFVVKQVTEVIPPQMVHLTDAAITDQWVQEQISTAIIPVLDYIRGESQSLDVVISLEPVVNNLKESLREEFLQLPPSEVAGLPPAAVEQYFDNYFQGLASGIPSTLVINESMLGANLPAQIDELSQGLMAAIPETFVIDESMIGTDVPAQIAKSLAEAETALKEVRQYVGYFQLGYKLLIGFMVLLVISIILISRQVRDVTRRLGVPCLTYGAFEYAGTFVGKYFIRGQVSLPDVPPSLQTWIFQFIDNLMHPLEVFSLGLVIGGIALIIVSFIYKPRQP